MFSKKVLIQHMFLLLLFHRGSNHALVLYSLFITFSLTITYIYIIYILFILLYYIYNIMFYYTFDISLSISASRKRSIFSHIEHCLLNALMHLCVVLDH